MYLKQEGRECVLFHRTWQRGEYMSCDHSGCVIKSFRSWLPHGTDRWQRNLNWLVLIDSFCDRRSDKVMVCACVSISWHFFCFYPLLFDTGWSLSCGGTGWFSHTCNFLPVSLLLLSPLLSSLVVCLVSFSRWHVRPSLQAAVCR